MAIIEENISANGDMAIDFDTNKVKTYVRIKMLYMKDFQREIRSIGKVFMSDNMPEALNEQLAFLRKLARYEKQHQYRYESHYQTICGVKITLLLPRKIKTLEQKRKVIRNFMNRVNPIGYKIPWIASEETHGTANYVSILLSEREYLDHTQEKRYNRNYYDHEGNITHKKGEIMYNKKNQPLKEHVLFSKKTRLFCFKKNAFKRMVGQLVDCFVEAVKSVLEKINTRFVIKKKTAKGRWHYFNRKVCQEINAMKQYVEFYCNYAVTLMRDEDADRMMEIYRARSAPVPNLEKITTVFHKFKARFEKESFHDRNGELRKIAYQRVSLPILEGNLDVLKKEFQQEILTIVPTIFE